VDKITWEQIVELEPMLLTLYSAARRADKGGESFCTAYAWYGEFGFKEQMLPLVGHEREEDEPEILNLSEAYDIAYNKILSALPPCRNCRLHSEDHEESYGNGLA
jgi:hypothetical protein